MAGELISKRQRQSSLVSQLQSRSFWKHNTIDVVEHTFPKSAKLCGQMTINHLYAHGKRFVVWPLRVTWLPASDATQVLIWAPKSLFKHAVDRNHLRRLMREAYRLNQDLLQNTACHYQVAFNYMDKTIHPYVVIEKSVRKVLMRLAKESLNQTPPAEI
ncbi:MAG: ribonuclease P protein component [Paludibacteraceae bacterium]|nr:ribonuclease P protein component [Paludibacteraceae bacterium]